MHTYHIWYWQGIVRYRTFAFLCDISRKSVVCHLQRRVEMCIFHHVFHNIVADTVFDVWILPHIFIDFTPFIFGVFISHISNRDNHSSLYPSELLRLSILFLNKLAGYLALTFYGVTAVIMIHAVTFSRYFKGDFRKVCWYHSCHTVIVVHSHNHCIIKTYISVYLALFAWILYVFPNVT